MRVCHHGNKKTRGMVGLMITLMSVMCFCSEHKEQCNKLKKDPQKRVIVVCSYFHSHLPTGDKGGRRVCWQEQRDLQRVKRVSVKIRFMCSAVQCNVILFYGAMDFFK
jgi:hypothetical protein